MIVPDDLRILTVKQPWASLIVDGIKDIENRSWAFPGTLPLPCTIAVHAGKRPDPITTATDLPTGCVLGLVDVIACARPPEHVRSPWAIVDQHHWVLANPVKFGEPVPARGRMGLLPVDTELLAAIRAAANT